MSLVAAALFAAQAMPLVLPARPPAPEPALQVWRPGEVRCDGAIEHFVALRSPNLALAWSEARSSVTLRFRIDASGRPLGIARDGTAYVAGGQDLAPSLAASRFTPGSGRRGCAVTYEAARVALADAQIDQLIGFTLTPDAGALPKSGWDRLYADATCNAPPRPEPLVRTFPDFRKLPATPGARDWSMVGYDLDHSGRPLRVHHVAGTGNAGLDRAATEAVARSRFASGDRTGCLYPYWRAAGVLAAPDAPPAASLRPTDATCPEHLPYARQPTLIFPQAWQKRAIEGWAVVAYDVAPWGATGNLRVLAAEPSTEFGEWASNMLRGATKSPSTTGYVGCVDRVIFRIGDNPRMLINGQPVSGGEGLPPPD